MRGNAQIIGRSPRFPLTVLALAFVLIMLGAAGALWAVPHFENDLATRADAVLGGAGIVAEVEADGRYLTVEVLGGSSVPVAVRDALTSLRGLREITFREVAVPTDEGDLSIREGAGSVRDRGGV